MLAKIIPLLALLVISASFAEQRFPIIEGGAITGYISPAGLNRIVVEGDRISSVKGTAGQFQIDKDPQLGQIFLQPTMVDKGEPIHLFITTEKGNTYSLSLLVHDLAPENIVLVPAAEAATKSEKLSYEMGLISLIKGMHHQLPLTGYAIEKVNLKKKNARTAKVNHIQTYTGDKLKGECYQIHNASKRKTLLEEKDFYEKGVLAIAVMNKTLAPNATTQVYVVKSNQVLYE